MSIYKIETQGRGIEASDIARAEAAIDAAIAREGLDAEGFAAAHRAWLASNDGEDHDAEAAGKFDRIQSSGNLALTTGWHDPNGAHLMLSPA